MKDNKFLDVTINGQSHALATGDNDLLAMHPFHNVPILSPMGFTAWRDNT